MSVTIDPERNEIDALLDLAGDFEGKRVLEIGAGYGRLTWRYAENAGKVVAIDPNSERIARAKENIPEELRGHVSILETTLEQYQHDGQASPYDVALMSWAL